MNENELVPLLVHIPATLRARLKVAAAVEDVTMTEVLTRILGTVLPEIPRQA